MSDNTTHQAAARNGTRNLSFYFNQLRAKVTETAKQASPSPAAPAAAANPLREVYFPHFRVGQPGATKCVGRPDRPKLSVKTDVRIVSVSAEHFYLMEFRGAPPLPDVGSPLYWHWSPEYAQWLDSPQLARWLKGDREEVFGEEDDAGDEDVFDGVLGGKGRGKIRSGADRFATRDERDALDALDEGPWYEFDITDGAESKTAKPSSSKKKSSEVNARAYWEK
jgi:hypothetical protein